MPNLGQYSTETLNEMREWIADCSWRDLDNPHVLTDADVVAGINRHYAGGVNQFLADNLFDRKEG